MTNIELILLGISFILSSLLMVLFWVVFVDISENNKYKTEKKLLIKAVKNALLTFYRTKNYEECISEIDILFRNLITKNTRLNNEFSNMVVLLENHIMDINSGTVNIESESVDNYKLAINNLLKEYKFRNPLEQIKGTDFLILKQLIDCVENQKIDEGREVINRIAVELKELKDKNLEIEKNTKKQDVIAKVGIILSCVFGVMTFMQFFD